VRFFLDRAAVIVVLSERWGTWMRSVTSNPRVVCIPNPVSLPAASSTSRDAALIAFVGRCEAGKGIFELLEAVNELRAAFPSVRLECAGDGDLEAVQRRVAELGMRSHVSLPGWLPRHRRDQLLARAAVFVLPSHAEGMPMSLLEAMAAGSPVVASAVGGIPDIVTHGVNGLLVPPGDAEALALALHRILADRKFAARLGKAARDSVERQYTVEQSLERLEQIYSALGVGRLPASPVAMPRRLQEIS
jgi:glycosyltransferase involved in cell wall biosynthesis